MATSQLAYAAEKAIGHDQEALQQDISNYNADGAGDPNETMKALVWQGKQKVEVGAWPEISAEYLINCERDANTPSCDSRCPETQDHRVPRCDSQGHRQHGLRE